MIVAIVLGAVAGVAITTGAVLLFRGDFPIRAPKALDPEYRHHEVMNCGLLAAVVIKISIIGSGAGAFLGFLSYLLIF